MSLGEILIRNSMGARLVNATGGGSRLREAVRGRRGVVSHHGAPPEGGVGAENAAFSTV